MHTRRLIAHTTLTIGFALGLLMCSSDKDEGDNIDGGGDRGSTGGSGATSSGGTSGAGTGSTGTGSTGTGSTGTGSTGTGGGGGNVPVDACNGLPLEEGSAGSSSGSGEGGACTGVGQEVEAFPVDMLIVMDRSTSMGYEVSPDVRRLDLFKQAVTEFAQSPEAANIGAGLVYFPAVGNETVICDSATYETPDVPIAPLGTNSDAIVDSITATEAGALTPVVTALQGAVVHAREWATAHPDRATVIVLVSDANPTQCETQPAMLAEVAGEAFDGTPSIPVYSITVGASATSTNWNAMNLARAGGTVEPFVAADESAADDFVDALLNITMTELSCEFKLPEPPSGQDLDLEKVSMVYTSGTGNAEEVPFVESYAGCANSRYGGWYYDNPTDPNSIRVCPCTCSNFGAGSIEVRLGCTPQTPYT